MPPPAHQQVKLSDDEMAALVRTWLRFKEEKQKQLHGRIDLAVSGTASWAGNGEIYQVIQKVAVELVAKRLGPYADGEPAKVPLLATSDFDLLRQAFKKTLAEMFGPLSADDERKADDAFNLGVEGVMRRLVIGEKPYDAMLDRIDWMMNVCYALGIDWDKLTLTERQYDWIARKLHRGEKSFRDELAAETDPLVKLFDDPRVEGVGSADPAAAEIINAGFRQAIAMFIDEEVRRVFA